MKKYIKMLLFFLLILMQVNVVFTKTHSLGQAKNQINIEQIELQINSHNMNKIKNIKSNINNENIVLYLKNMGLTEEEIAKFLIKDFDEIINKIETNNKTQNNDEICVVENSCQIKINKGENGKYFEKQNFCKEVINKIKQNVNKFKININYIQYKNNSIDQKKFVKRSQFSTNFSTSSEERKNNIKTAMKKFDGLIIKNGEEFSFNEITGVRNEESGYKQAKIISGGTLVQGYGGGVCQVSTTLYNACLLSGLEIKEVHNHSLPVSYVEPGFDAMVNFGSSDLIVKNNTGDDIIITSSDKNDFCKFAIFGVENKNKITRLSEKTKIIKADDLPVIETDYKKYGIENLQDGEEIVISNAKDGFWANAYLTYYDKNENQIKTEKIREVKYSPTKKIIVKA